MHMLFNINQSKKIFIILGLFILTGCVVPGDGVVSFKVEGQFDKKKFSSKKIKIEYFEHYLNKEKLTDLNKYKNKIIIQSKVDTLGKFKTDKVDIMHPVMVWLLPPLGLFGKKTPEYPIFTFQTQSKCFRKWLVYFDEEKNKFIHFKVNKNDIVSKTKINDLSIHCNLLKNKNGWLVYLNLKEECQ